jgi:mannosyl-oligosaccharide alpha-1,2-mannosidase
MIAGDYAQRNEQDSSFWLAETLKYLYLSFDDPERINQFWVCNTEAHPLKRGRKVEWE